MSEKHETGDVPTTGHVWDEDLGDFTNQPPKWWMLGLTVSAIWVVIYWCYYPSIPVSLGGDYFKGLGGWSAIKEMEADELAVYRSRGKYEEEIKGKTPAAILANKDLTEYITRSSKVLFSRHCASCHGRKGNGVHDKHGLFAPKLNDDDWLYGGKIDTIYQSISEGRQGMMPAQDGILTAIEINTLAKAIVDGNPTSTPLFAQKGCAACHGADGKGIQAMGSANLTDKIWRFDGSVKGVTQTITYGVNAPGNTKTRVAVMPGFKADDKIDSDTMAKLAVYVYKFGGGQPDVPVVANTAAQAASAVPAVK